jgi:cell division protein ZapD
MAAPRVGQFLREDRLIGLVRQRLSIPGGCCSFDLPTLHMWLHMPQAQRDAQVNSWLASLEPMHQTLSLILDLIRNSAPFRKQTSLNGFYQDNGDDADLLRLNLSLANSFTRKFPGIRAALRFALCRWTAKMAPCRNASILNWPVVKECRCLMSPP